MNEERLALVEQQVKVLRNDMESAISGMLSDLAQTLTRMAQNIAKDMQALDKRIAKLEEQVPYHIKHPKPLDNDGSGTEL